MKKISVIVPIYNSEDHLESCLSSLVHQTISKDEIEILAIDDHSTDGSLSILKKFAQKFSQIKIFCNSTNLGVGATRNLGIKKATGEYIGFVDSDDYVNNSMYQKIYEFAKQNHFPDIIETRLLFVKDNSYLNEDLSYASSKNGYLLHGKNKIKQLPDLSPSVCNKVFKKTLIKQEKFLKNCKWEDILFTTTMGIKAKNILEISNSDYFYRRDITKGISSINYHANKNILDIFKITDHIMNFPRFYQKQKYKNSLYIICLSAIFKRVEELEFWNITEKMKEELKTLLYEMTYQRYGNLEKMDLAILSATVKSNILEEYLALGRTKKKTSSQRKKRSLQKRKS